MSTIPQEFLGFRAFSRHTLENNNRKCGNFPASVAPRNLWKAMANAEKNRNSWLPLKVD